MLVVFSFFLLFFLYLIKFVHFWDNIISKFLFNHGFSNLKLQLIYIVFQPWIWIFVKTKNIFLSNISSFNLCGINWIFIYSYLVLLLLGGLRSLHFANPRAFALNCHWTYPRLSPPTLIFPGFTISRWHHLSFRY